MRNGFRSTRRSSDHVIPTAIIIWLGTAALFGICYTLAIRRAGRPWDSRTTNALSTVFHAA